jgi:hypothetical protein
MLYLCILCYLNSASYTLVRLQVGTWHEAETVQEPEKEAFSNVRSGQYVKQFEIHA